MDGVGVEVVVELAVEVVVELAVEVVVEVTVEVVVEATVELAELAVELELADIAPFKAYLAGSNPPLGRRWSTKFMKSFASRMPSRRWRGDACPLTWMEVKRSFSEH